MRTWRLRKIRFLTGKMQWRKRRDFKSRNRLIRTWRQLQDVSRRAPAIVLGDIGDLLYERHALEKSENRKNELLEAMALSMIRQISADESRKRFFFCGHLISFIRN